MPHRSRMRWRGTAFRAPQTLCARWQPARPRTRKPSIWHLRRRWAAFAWPTLAVNEAAAREDPRAHARLGELARLFGGTSTTIASVVRELTELRRALGLPALA